VPFQRIRKFLTELDRRYFQCLSDIDDSIVDNVSEFFSGKGKRLRPAIVYLTAAACNLDISSQCHDFALLTELIHNASLFHDDVLDNAEKRRGRLSTNRLLGNDNAVLIGDLLYIKALKLIESQSICHRRMVTDTVLQMIQSEITQGLNRHVTLEEQTYLSIIKGKTAALISLAGFLGACASKNKTWIDASRSYGEKLGIAYQVTDDLLDWTGSQTGKDQYSDIREGRITLPLILLLKTMNESEKSKCIHSLCASKNRLDSGLADKYRDLMRERGIFQSIEHYVNKFVLASLAALEKLPDNEFRSTLQRIPSQLTQREF
jgi:octaprenyl-diphosphate synthase